MVPGPPARWCCHTPQAGGPAMSFWALPARVSAFIARLAAGLDRRTGERFWSVVLGVLICREKRRTASAWFRAAGIGVDFRRAYHVLGSVGRRAPALSRAMVTAICEVAGPHETRYMFALDDT